MALSTYAELLASIEDWLNRTDLTTRIPDFIRLFEVRMNRRLRDPGMETTSVQSTEAGVGEIALPTDFRGMRELYLDRSPKVVLEQLSPAELRSRYASDATGIPKHYAIIGEDLVLGPEPAGAYTLTLAYFRQIVPLTDTNTTNWLLDNNPDLYLWGSLTMAEAFLKDDDRVGLWKGAWDEAFDELQKDAIKRRYGAAPLQASPSVIE